MTGARVLAIAGAISSICAVVGGFFDLPIIIGAGGSVMLFANVFVAFGGAK